MGSDDELNGKVVAGVERDGDTRGRIRFTDGTVAEFDAWATHEDAYLDCKVFSQDEWHETLTARRAEEARMAARLAVPRKPFWSPIWDGVMDDMKREFNRQVHEPSVIGQYVTFPIHRSTGVTDD